MYVLDYMIIAGTYDCTNMNSLADMICYDVAGIGELKEVVFSSDNLKSHTIILWSLLFYNLN